MSPVANSARRVTFGVLVAASALLAACAGNSAATSVSAAAAPEAASAPIAGSVDAVGAPFVGSRRTKKFYPSACHTVSLIRAADRVGFTSMKDAESAGFARDLYSTDCKY